MLTPDDLAQTHPGDAQGRGQLLLGQSQRFKEFIPEDFSRQCRTAVARQHNLSRLMVLHQFQIKDISVGKTKT